MIEGKGGERGDFRGMKEHISIIIFQPSSSGDLFNFSVFCLLIISMGVGRI